MKQLSLLVGCLTLLAAAPAVADVDEAEIRALREQIRSLSERLDQLERQARATERSEASSVATAPASERRAGPAAERAVENDVQERSTAASWIDRIRFAGDFRYRFENIEIDGSEDRDRNRIRARMELQADVSDALRVGVGLATGGSDPTSTNVTLGSGGSSKDVRLDLAWFEWSPRQDTRIIGGKHRNPLVRPGGSQLVWDSDWRPEGLAFRHQSGMLFTSGIATWLESDSHRDKQFSWGVQGGLTLPVAGIGSWRFGAGYYGIDTAGGQPLFGGGFFGNSFDQSTGTYRFDYRLLEGFTEFSSELLGRPAVAFGHYVHNADAPEADTGYAFGFRLGELRSRGSWRFGYNYTKVEADAVLGLLTNSDFGGGGTDVKGSIFKGAYALGNGTYFELTYFLNEIGLRSGQPRDYDRVQLDLNFEYE